MPFIVYGAMHNFAPNLSNINGNYGIIRIETSTSNSKNVLKEVEEVEKIKK